MCSRKRIIYYTISDTYYIRYYIYMVLKKLKSAQSWAANTKNQYFSALGTNVA